jgi:hypothetical protein
MGLSGFSGLTGSAGDFRRRLRVDESSERRMASPWQFSPYLPSLSKCSAARSQRQRALRHVFGKTALAAIRDRDPEPALLEPYADRKACVQVVIDHQDVTHDPPPLRYRMRRAGDPSLKKGRPFTQTPGGVLPLRISMLSHFRRNSPACLPSTVYMASSTT